MHWAQHKIHNSAPFVHLNENKMDVIQTKSLKVILEPSLKEGFYEIPSKIKEYRYNFTCEMLSRTHLQWVQHSFKDRGFLRKIQKMHFFLKKYLIRKTNDHQKVLLNSFPMNGHVSMFRQS
jgi:hypothetical protein